MNFLLRSSRFRFALAALPLVALALSAGTDSTLASTTKKDIVDTAVSAGTFQTLVAAVESAGLVDTFKGDGPYTVFAPNDEAFQLLPAGTLQSLLGPENKEQLTAILTYHVVPGRVLARQAFSLPAANTVNGQRVKITNDGGKLSINNSQLLATDIECSNGVIHVIDKVLLPEQERIPAVAKRAGKFSTLLAAAAAAGLADVLDGDGPFTVLAPTDTAFNKLPTGTVDSLLKPESRQKLVNILKYHVLAGGVYSDQVANVSQADTLLGRLIEPSVGADGLKINDSRVVQADIDTANGLIHVIDSVLLPQPMSSEQALQTLRKAINRGVPLFNHGNASACADIYDEACQQIVDSAGEDMPRELIMTLKTTLDRSKQIHNSTARAWALRYAMDSAFRLMADTNSTSDVRANESERLLFDFDGSDAIEKWRTVNDGVMGGVSDGRHRVTEQGWMEFYGTLSLDNNGGFASVRSIPAEFRLNESDVIVARVRGDGRRYYMNLRVATNRTAFSYRASFQTTKAGEWKEIRVPVTAFQATSYGRQISNASPVDPDNVNSIGFLLADKIPGEFSLEVDWIKVVGGESA